MPGLATSPYQTGAQLLSLIQTLCSDPQGQLFTASFCLNAINSGARRLARELRNRGKMTLEQDFPLITIPAVTTQDAAQQVNVAYTGISGDVTAGQNPALPANLLEPLILWERPSGMAATTKLVEMLNMTAKGGISKAPQGNFLREWEWRQDMIVFRGSLSATDVIIRGTVTGTVFTLDDQGNLSGQLQDVDSLDAVAHYASAELLPQRGASTLATQYEGKGDVLTEQLSTSLTRQEQLAPVRMRGYRSRRVNNRNGWRTL
jgi:hypothetical protein